MGTLLLQNPWVQVYLLYAAALFSVLIWDRLLNAPATWDDDENLRGRC
jgi:hypothetical protein